MNKGTRKGLYILISSISIAFILLPNLVFTLDENKNPEKPAGKDTIRRVQIREVMRIQDDPENEIFFRLPYVSRHDDKGNIYILERDQIYKFGPDGKFLLKMFKKGEGPGELSNQGSLGFFSAFFVVKDRVLVSSKYPDKFTQFNTDGEFQEEKRLSFITIMHIPKFFITSDINYYYFDYKTTPSFRQLPPGPFSYTLPFCKLSPDFEKQEEIYRFESEGYRSKTGWTVKTPLITQKDSTTLLINVSYGYQILNFDLRKRKVTKTYTRKYKKIKTGYGNYDSAVIDLLYVSPHLWVVTSTRDENNNPLIDIFDLNKGFKESLYLIFPNPDPENFSKRKISFIDKDFVYTIESNPEGFYSVIKYRME